METLLYVIFFVSCLVLVVAVLLQPGKTDAGALFTSGVSSAALNPRGTQSVLSKITIGAATVFMVAALLLSLPVLTGNRSVIQSGETEPAETANTNVNANANTAAPAANANSAASTTVEKEPAANTAEKPAQKTDEKKDSKPAEKDGGAAQE
ncbi:MAG: preprotein translocase subunit SecG [Acidobacteriota bacterium]|nr:preprotein translocase subunit SecG [Acidobacteriota bacterium]MDH3530219.1 preprotein translocase subunit SecG [Acidobacteriota bacterium]